MESTKLIEKSQAQTISTGSPASGPVLSVTHSKEDPHNASKSQMQLRWKTKICMSWLAHSCTQGAACRYAHGKSELRQAPPAEESERSRQQQHRQNNNGTRNNTGMNTAKLIRMKKAEHATTVKTGHQTVNQQSVLQQQQIQYQQQIQAQQALQQQMLNPQFCPQTFVMQFPQQGFYPGQGFAPQQAFPASYPNYDPETLLLMQQQMSQQQQALSFPQPPPTFAPQPGFVSPPQTFSTQASSQGGQVSLMGGQAFLAASEVSTQQQQQQQHGGMGMRTGAHQGDWVSGLFQPWA